MEIILYDYMKRAIHVLVHSSTVLQVPLSEVLGASAERVCGDTVPQRALVVATAQRALDLQPLAPLPHQRGDPHR